MNRNEILRLIEEDKEKIHKINKRIIQEKRMGGCKNTLASLARERRLVLSSKRELDRVLTLFIRYLESPECV